MMNTRESKNKQLIN